MMKVNTFNYINLDYLEMMSDGDLDMKKVMLEMLFEELPQEMKKMKHLLNTNQFKELCSVSHKMKSTLAFVGNNEMTKANTEIETITKNNIDTDRLSSLINVLMELYPKSLEELKVEHSNC